MALPGLSFETARAATPRLGIRTDRVGLIALTERGPEGVPVLVHSWEHFVDVFGCPVPGMLGALAMEVLAKNGAEQVVVSRVVPRRQDALATLAAAAAGFLTTAVDGGSVPLVMGSPGGYGNRVEAIAEPHIEATLAGGTIAAQGRVRFEGRIRGIESALVGRVLRVFVAESQHWARITNVNASPSQTEISFQPALASATPAGSAAAMQVMDWQFTLRVREAGRADTVVGGLDLRRPDAMRALLSTTPIGLAPAAVARTDIPLPGFVARFAGGADGIADVDIHDPANLDALAESFRRAFRALDNTRSNSPSSTPSNSPSNTPSDPPEAVPTPDIVIAPDLWSRIYRTKGVFRLALDTVRAISLGDEMVQRAARQQDRVVLLDPPLSAREVPAPITAAELVQWRAERKTKLGNARDFAATYAPWLRIPSELSYRGDDALLMTPSAAVAGQMAKDSRERGPWIATGNVALGGVLGLSTTIMLRPERERLSAVGINNLAVRPPEGVTIQGVRSLAWPDRKPWRFLSTRRLFNYLQRALAGVGRSYVFEPNVPETWISLRRDVSAMLENLFRSGALAGSTPSQAFFVKVDAELNPPDVRDAGALNAHIGVAPAVPLEFLLVHLALQRDTADVVVSTTAPVAEAALP